MRALDTLLSYARRHHIAWYTSHAAAGLASIRLARAEYDAFDTLAAGPATDNLTWSILRAQRLLWQADLKIAVQALPEPALAGGVPTFLAQVSGARANVLWQAGEAEAACGEWARLLEVLPGDVLTAVVDGVSVHQAIHLVGDALPHLADAAFLAAVEHWLQNQEAAGRDWVYDLTTAECAARQAGMVSLWLGNLDEAQERLQRALAWCERERCPVEAGRCLQGLAEVAERRGQRQEALGYLEWAAVLFEQYGAKLYLEQVRAARERLIQAHQHL